MDDETLDRASARASGAPRRAGNRVRLLKDAAENYPAWLDAIASARRTVHCEMYISHDDEQGKLFADVLMKKAAEGVAVRLLYDWIGACGNSPWSFWHRLKRAKVDVRCYNPPRLSRPLGWISRDHRKAIIVDGTVAFVTGLCIGRAWVGNPSKHLDGWRDTGIELHGPAVADVNAAFADSWATFIVVDHPRDTAPAVTLRPVWSRASREKLRSRSRRLDAIVTVFKRSSRSSRRGRFPRTCRSAR